MHLVYTIQFQALDRVHPITYPIIPPMWSTMIHMNQHLGASSALAKDK